MNATPARYRAIAIRRTIDSQGRKVGWLADELRVSRQYVSDVVNGKRTVNETTARRISSALGIPFFLGWELQECNSQLQARAEEAAA